MFKWNKVIQRMNALSIVLVVVFIVTMMPVAAICEETSEREVSEYVQKARVDAEKARADAEKAMAEAEKAMAEADQAIAEAEKLKHRAKKDKAEAMEKMVDHGYFPEDIAMTNPENTTIAVFSHKKHTERERLKCIECHPRVFIMKVGKNVAKKGQLTMSEMKKGKFCGNCHNGHKAFSVSDINSCKRCHPKSK